MSQLNEDIKAAIEKQLPAEVGKLLMQRLSEGHNAEVELKGTKEYLRQSREKVTELTKQVEDAGNLYKLKKELDAREREVEKKEIRIELTEARAKAAEEKEAAIQRLVGTVFSNRRIVREMTRQSPGAPDEYGNRPTEYSEERHTTHEE